MQSRQGIQSILFVPDEPLRALYFIIVHDIDFTKRKKKKDKDKEKENNFCGQYEGRLIVSRRVCARFMRQFGTLRDSKAEISACPEKLPNLVVNLYALLCTEVWFISGSEGKGGIAECCLIAWQEGG